MLSLVGPTLAVAILVLACFDVLVCPGVHRPQRSMFTLNFKLLIGHRIPWPEIGL